ncbi:MAG: putative protein N(5)-glutamine methyltransferase [Actinobacteria bacterium]|nr:putative protein N(5)-glutamine methyltransferase [Actinomycetota bacterium]
MGCARRQAQRRRQLRQRPIKLRAEVRGRPAQPAASIQLREATSVPVENPGASTGRHNQVIDEASTIARLRAAGCVFAEDEARLLRGQADTPERLEEWVERRTAGEPLETILGWAEFAGLRMQIEANVFVPRRRTEFLVTVAERQLRPHAVVLDLCCGCGAVGAALATRVRGLQLHAVDLDPRAIKCARDNLPPSAHLYVGDLYQGLPAGLRQRVDVIVANAPYVPTAEIAYMPTEARDHEPRLALDGGIDGVELHRRIAEDANDWLRPGGWLMIETSGIQVAATTNAVIAGGLAVHCETDDELEATVVVGTRAS